MKGESKPMQKDNISWYQTWFNTPYYPILYKDRNHREAAFFMNKLTSFLKLQKNDSILDLACGRGRHSKYLYKQGFDVTGVDLSPHSIEDAKQYETKGLHFEVHDMRLPYPKQFDAVFNLYTSFGYFESNADNIKTIRSIKSELKPDAFGIIDFLNVKQVKKNLVPYETKLVGGILFKIKRSYNDNYIFKNIEFTHNNEEYFFTEKLRALTLEDFENYFEATNVKLRHCFGDYQLQDYNEKTADRLILIFN